jgi:hypothetical protein
MNVIWIQQTEYQQMLQQIDTTSSDSGETKWKSCNIQAKLEG